MTGTIDTTKELLVGNINEALQTALTNGNLRETLLRKDFNNRTGLHHAFQDGDASLIRAVIQSWTDVADLQNALQAVDDGGNAPLTYLLDRDDSVEMLKVLLQVCTSDQFDQIIQVKDAFQHSILHFISSDFAGDDNKKVELLKVISAEVAARGKGDLLNSELNATDGFGKTAAEWLGDTAAIKLEQMSKPIAQNAKETTAGFFSASAATLATKPEKREIDNSIAYKAGAMHREYDDKPKPLPLGYPQDKAAADAALTTTKATIAAEEVNIQGHIATLKASPLTAKGGKQTQNAAIVTAVKAAATELLDNGPNAAQALADIVAATGPANGAGGNVADIQAVDTALQGLQTSAKALATARADLIVAEQNVAHYDYQEPSKVGDQIGILSSTYSDNVLWATKKGLEEAKTHLTPDSILYNISDAGIGFIDNYGPWFNPVTQVCVAGVQLYLDPKHAVTHGFEFFVRSGLLSGRITPAASKYIAATLNADPDNDYDYSKEIQSGFDASISLLSSAAIAYKGGSFSSRQWSTMPMPVKISNGIKLIWDVGKFIMIPLQTFSNYVLSSPKPNAYMSDETALTAKRTSEGFLKGGQTIYTFSAFGLWGKLLPLMGEAIGVARDSDLTPNGKQIALSVASRVPVASMLVNTPHDNGQIRAFYNSKLTEAYEIFQNVFLAMHCSDATTEEWKAVADVASGIREGLKSTTRSYNGYVEVKSIELMDRDKSGSYSDVERAYAAFTSGGDDLGLKNNGFKEVRAAWQDIINELQKQGEAANIAGLQRKVLIAAKNLITNCAYGSFNVSKAIEIMPPYGCTSTDPNSCSSKDLYDGTWKEAACKKILLENSRTEFFRDQGQAFQIDFKGCEEYFAILNSTSFTETERNDALINWAASATATYNLRPLNPSADDVNVNRIFPATITKEQAERYFAEKAANPGAGVAVWIVNAGIKGVFDAGTKDPVCGVYGHHSISELMIRLISEGYQIEDAQRNKIAELSTECLQSHKDDSCTELGTEFAKIVVHGETPFHADHSSST